jgi:Fe-S-cluster containining protein
MARKKRRRPDPAERALLAELKAVYERVEQAYADYACEGTTECCRFAVTGREPYVTSIEVLAVERAVAARGGPLKEKRRALPIAHDTRDDERVCPMLNEQARCAIYADRPLGCRSFWCHRAQSERRVDQGELNGFVREVQDIAARHQHAGDKGRPLTRALGELGLD